MVHIKKFREILTIQILHYPLIIIILALLGLFIGVIIPIYPSIIWLLLIIFTIIAIIIKPILGIFLLVPLGLFFSGYYIGLFPIRYYIYFLLTITWVARIKSSQSFRVHNEIVFRMILVGGIYIIWTFIREISYSNLMDSLNNVGGNILVGYLTAIFILVNFRDIKQVKHLIIFLASWIFISAFVAIMQFIKIPFFIGLKTVIWNFVSNEEQRRQGLMLITEGATGLSGTTLLLGYTTSFVLPIILSLYLFSKKKCETLFYLLTIIILLSGLISSLLMSGLLGGIIASTIVIWLKENNKYISFIKAFIFLLVILLIANNVLPRTIVQDTFDISGLSRIPLAIVGLRTALDNPIGISTREYFFQARAYVSDVVGMEGYELIYNATPHNNFINVLVLYGLPGLILYAIFIYYLWKALLSLRKSIDDRIMYPIILGLIGAFIANFTNSITHNAGLFLGEVIAWYGIGIVWVILNINVNSSKHRDSKKV